MSISLIGGTSYGFIRDLESGDFDTFAELAVHFGHDNAFNACIFFLLKD